MTNERWMIVGLGNPGPEYEGTRHNIGFRCADALARAHGLTYERQKKSKAKIAQGLIAGRPVLIAKPQAYMNLSGSAVQGLAAFYRIPPQRILVILDDLDLPRGTLRIRAKGGSGGHKGLQDIIVRLGTQDFPRIRFGIGRPPERMDPAAYVLRPFDSSEIPEIESAIERVRCAVQTWLSEGIEIAMNRYNGSAEEVAARQAPPRAATPPDHSPTEPGITGDQG